MFKEKLKKTLGIIVAIALFALLGLSHLGAPASKMKGFDAAVNSETSETSLPSFSEILESYTIPFADDHRGWSAHLWEEYGWSVIQGAVVSLVSMLCIVWLIFSVYWCWPKSSAE